MKLILFAVAMLLSATAQAEVYRCVENGKQVFSDVPCSKDAEKLKVSPAAGSGDETRSWVNNAIAVREVRVGMTDKEVIRSWGKLDRINKSISASGTHEQWVYYRGSARAQYVYVDNGIVSSASE